MEEPVSEEGLSELIERVFAEEIERRVAQECEDRVLTEVSERLSHLRAESPVLMRDV
jgi:hypothetical protein